MGNVLDGMSKRSVSKPHADDFFSIFGIAWWYGNTVWIAGPLWGEPSDEWHFSQVAQQTVKLPVIRDTMMLMSGYLINAKRLLQPVADILQTLFWKAFSWKKMFVFWLEYYEISVTIKLFSQKNIVLNWICKWLQKWCRISRVKPIYI